MIRIEFNSATHYIPAHVPFSVSMKDTEKEDETAVCLEYTNEGKDFFYSETYKSDSAQDVYEELNSQIAELIYE